MNILVVYDSVFGNTKKIAQAIGDTLRSQSDISVQPVGDVKIDQLHGLDLLIVGSPTRIFKPTKAINGFLGGIPGGGIEGLDVAAFDTRFAPEDIESRFLHFMVKRFGYAAEPILEKLKKKGGEEIITPEGFIVSDTEGPLKEGELKKAAEWAKEILQRIS